MVEPRCLALADDGVVPNSRLPLLLYRAALAGGGEAQLAAMFTGNGWGGLWVDGIYPFQHYHATAHEVLGIACGSARVQLGGPRGPVIEVGAGDAVVIPAGAGHCRLGQSPDLSVVGAYPAGQVADLRRATASDRTMALPLLARVPTPSTDPIHGAAGPLLRLWR